MDLWQEPAFRCWVEALRELVLTLDGDGRITGLELPEDASFPLALRRGAHYREVLPASAADALQIALGLLASTGAAQRLSLELDHGGLRRHFTAKLGRLSYRGHDAGALIVVWDVTDRARIESETFQQLLAENIAMLEELKQARARAEAASEAKSEFLASMSHALRTPLHGMLGMAELLDGTHLTDEQRQYASAIRESGQLLASILSDLRDLSKIEGGRLELRQAPFDLVDTVEGLADVLGTQAAAKGNELRLHVASGVPTVVEGDGQRLRQALANLLSNANRRTSGGSLGVEVTAGASARLRFRVTDTGSTLCDEEVALATGERHVGTQGVGLAIARRRVELMGGSLEIVSRTPGATCFGFELALPAVERDTAAPQREQLRGVRALVCDAVAETRQWTRDTLEHAGAEVEVARGGVEVMRVLQEEAPFQCVVLDAELPDIDGAAVASIIRADARFATLPIVLVTPPSTSSEPRTAEDLRVNAALERPLRPEVLLRAVGEAAAGGSFSDDRRQQAGATVLVVEDNEVNLRLARELLRRAGYHVLGAGSAREALRALEASPVDAVLMDIQLPDLDGLQATALIRQRPAWARLPVIAMTAHAMKGDAERFIEAGLDDYLSKPVDRRELLEVLAREISKRTR